MNLHEELDEEQRRKLAEMFDDSSILTENLDQPTSDTTRPVPVKPLPDKQSLSSSQSMTNPAAKYFQKPMSDKKLLTLILGSLSLIIVLFVAYLLLAN